jgi:hypothetical protein
VVYQLLKFPVRLVFPLRPWVVGSEHPINEDPKRDLDVPHASTSMIFGD